MTERDERLAPLRRQRGPVRPAVPAVADPDAADLARGQAAAVLGALGRLQLRVELLAREQSDALAAISAQLVALEERVTELTIDHDAHVGPRPAREPAAPGPAPLGTGDEDGPAPQG